MLNIIEQNGGKFVTLTDLYEKLELSKTNFPKFCKEQIKLNEYANEGKEFYYLGTKTTEKGGRPKEDFLLTLEFAKDIIIRSKSKVGKKYRDWLIGLETKADNNQLLTIEKSALAYKMIQVFKFGQFQMEAEAMHKDHFILTTEAKGNIHKVFAEHRNTLLNINNEDLKTALVIAFQKGLAQKPQAKNIRGRIALLDRYTLMRNAVADYLLSIGQTTHNALTFADSVTQIAKIAGVEIRIKDEDTLFNEHEHTESPQLMALKQTKQLI